MENNVVNDVTKNERYHHPDQPITYKKFSLHKFFASFDHAVRGVVFLLKSEQNARVHAVITILVGVLAYILEVSRVESAILFMAVILVFAIEIINTAIEKVFDVCHPEDHALIRAAKDAMAGAVLISAIIASVVAIFIFLPYIKRLVA
ncbi:MAG: diacylglycerol kinase family protein [Candidatus Berkelbacteria bacterium]|nr:diacylglycerol kinase family protein [Candidatus Berkelbacteria bacterium]